MQKIFAIVIITVLAIILWLNWNVGLNNSHKNVVDIAADQGPAKEASDHMFESDLSAKLPEQTEVEHPLDYQANQKTYLSKCGLEDMSDFYINSLRKDNININELSKQQQQAFNQLTSNQFCEDWYQYVKSLSNDDQANLEEVMNEPRLVSAAFNSLEDEEKSLISKRVLNNEANDINKRVALHYLLTKDWDFIKQVAAEINTTNLSLISGSSLKLVTLHECQENPSICDSNSSQMLSRCVFNENHCNLSYLQYLENTHTANEVSDFFNILAAVRRLLSS